MSPKFRSNTLPFALGHAARPTSVLFSSLVFAMGSGCAGYKVVDYPSAIEDVPQAVTVNWDYSEARIGRKSEKEWLESRRRDKVRQRHETLKGLARAGYVQQLDEELAGVVAVSEGVAPAGAVQLNIHVEQWSTGMFVPTADPHVFGPAPTFVRARVEFVKNDQAFEQIAIECVIDAKPWTPSPWQRLEMCGEVLGEKTARYFKKQAAS